MSLWTIICCGDSARNWEPRGTTLGVNDSWKFGKPTDILLCCNRPVDFTKDRLRTITTSTPKTFYSHKGNWAYAFPDWKKIHLHNWSGSRYFVPYMNKPIEHKMTYSSNTSSFIALSLAYNLGAKEIIMYGIDFMNHKVYHEGAHYRDKEVQIHLDLIKCMKEHGTEVYLGALGTAFDQTIPLYDTNKSGVTQA